jgi:hypothetical protein
MITVKVCYQSSGEPAEDKTVSLGVEELFRTDYELTDSDGEAHFNVEPCPGRVFVDGSIAFKGYLEERIVVYV